MDQLRDHLLVEATSTQSIDHLMQEKYDSQDRSFHFVTNRGRKRLSLLCALLLFLFMHFQKLFPKLVRSVSHEQENRREATKCLFLSHFEAYELVL